MASALDIVKGGFSGGQAKAIQGQVGPDLTAAGTTQGTAAAIVASVTIVTTAAESSGVILPDSEIGDEYEILNLGANPVAVYPPSGARVNALGTNVGFLLAPNTAVKVKKFTTTRWMGFLSA